MYFIYPRRAGGVDLQGNSRLTTGRDGFTLTEVMVAFSVFLLIALAYSAAILAAMRSQTLAGNHYVAGCIARNRVERAKSMAFSNLPSMQETERLVDGDGNATSQGRYVRTTTVRLVTPTCTMVSVAVRFPMGRVGLSREPVEVQTLIGDNM